MVDVKVVWHKLGTLHPAFEKEPAELDVPFQQLLEAAKSAMMPDITIGEVMEANGYVWGDKLTEFKYPYWRCVEVADKFGRVFRVGTGVAAYVFEEGVPETPEKSDFAVDFSLWHRGEEVMYGFFLLGCGWEVCEAYSPVGTGFVEELEAKIPELRQANTAMQERQERMERSIPPSIIDVLDEAVRKERES